MRERDSEIETERERESRKERLANETLRDKIFDGDYSDETNLKLSVIFQIEKYLWHFFEMTSDSSQACLASN